MSGTKFYCPSCGQWSPRSVSTRKHGVCAGCYASDRDGEDVAVSGRELERLRGDMSREDLAATINATGKGYELSAADISRLEGSLIHKSFVNDVAKLLKERNGTNMTDTETTIEQRAADAKRAFEDAEREALDLAETMMAHVHAALDLAAPVRTKLQARYRAWAEAIRLERHAMLARGEDWRTVEGDVADQAAPTADLVPPVRAEDLIPIHPFHPGRLLANGNCDLIQIAVMPEMGLTAPAPTDDSLAAWRTVEFSPSAVTPATPVPFDAAARRKARA